MPMKQKSVFRAATLTAALIWSGAMVGSELAYAAPARASLESSTPVEVAQVPQQQPGIAQPPGVAQPAVVPQPAPAAPQPYYTQPPQSAQPVIPADQALSQPSRWPLIIESGGDQVIMYQPQLESFSGDTLAARAAVSVQKPGQQDPVYGVVWLQSRVAVDRVARTVQILDANITKARFPDAPPADQQALLDALRQRLANNPKVLSLDQLLKMLEIVQQEKAVDENIVNTPPQIVFAQQPTVKVQYDGAPRLTQAPNTNLMRAINTPFFVALDPVQKTYYLKGAGQWFAAPDPLGPFRPAGAVPAAVAQLADQSGYQDPQQPLPPREAGNLAIVTATVPTELIWTDGSEEWGTIPGTSLLFVSNTDSDVFLDLNSQNLYVLLSGRWYTSRSRSGPWTYVAPDKLPPDFARIPPNSPKGEVLAHVAGTAPAQDAIADTYIPQTAAIDRANYEQPPITYDGAPQFQPVEGTVCTYAVNTPYSVVSVNHRYYCCYQAVWYECDAPTGRWALCTTVPPEIYLLPPSCPIYAVKYCHVYGFTPDVVYVGYTPGYIGCYTYGGCVVYGTGYAYRPWVSEHHFYPRPYTFGFAAHYEAYSAHWGFEVASARGGGAYWIGSAREVERGHEDAHHGVPGGRWFGYGGYRPANIRNENITIVNNRTVNNVRNVTNVNRNQTNIINNLDSGSRNLYQRRADVRKEATARGAKVASRAPQTPGRATNGAPLANNAQRNANNAERNANAQRNVNNAQRTANNAQRTASSAQNAQARNNVYADPQGNVHRKTLDGWETRQGGKWVPESPANTTPPARNTAGTSAPRETQRPTGQTPRESAGSPARSNPAPTRQPNTPARVETPSSVTAGSRQTPPRDTNTRETQSPRETNTRQTPPRETNTRQTSPRETNTRETPTPRETNTRETTPSRNAAPSRSSSASLNQDLRARVAGRDRYENSPRPQPEPSRPTQAPERAQPAPRSESPQRSEAPQRQEQRSSSGSRSDSSSRGGR